jgi:hypothetical protein
MTTEIPNRPSIERKLSVQEILATFDKWRFRNIVSLEDFLVNVFNANLHNMPPHYSYYDFGAWAIKKGWIGRSGREGFSINTSSPVVPKEDRDEDLVVLGEVWSQESYHDPV